MRLGWTASADPTLEEESIDLGEMVAVLRRQIWLVLFITLLVIAVSAYIVYTQEPLYRANAVLRIQAGAAVMEQAMGKTPDPVFSQIELLRSRGVVAAVVERTGLRISSPTHGFPSSVVTNVVVPDETARDTMTARFGTAQYTIRKGDREVTAAYGEPVDIAGIRFAVAERPETDEATFLVHPRQVAVNRFLENLSATLRESTNIVDVRYTSSDPLLAQRVVNTAIEEYQARSARMAQQQSIRRRIFMEEQLQQTDSALVSAQMALTEFQQREGVYSSQEDFAAQQAGLMQLEIRREELNADRTMYRSLLEGIMRGEEGEVDWGLTTLVSAPGIASNPVITQLYGQLVRYEVQLDSLCGEARARIPMFSVSARLYNRQRASW